MFFIFKLRVLFFFFFFFQAEDGIRDHCVTGVQTCALPIFQLHRHPEALAQALRMVTRSLPFEGLAELETLDVPSLVVASYDEADPGHPYSIAEAWAERLPAGRLISEEPGKSPLAWQGGRLSRAIAEFLKEPGVRERLS